MGGSGSGKTYSIRTLIQAGIKPFIIFTEPGMETLSDLPAGSFEWVYIPPSGPSWSALRTAVEQVNKLSYENLLKQTDPNKTKLTHFFEVLKHCENFKGSYGDVTSWGTDRALVIDSLSGLSEMAMQMTVGLRIVKAQHEWGEAQNIIEQFVNKLTTDLRCWLVVLAHVERETDEITGGSKIMVSTLGRKLAPKLPRFFSDVILTVREQKSFYWDTAAYGTDLKTRNLPIESKLQPSFVPLVEAWKSKGGVIEKPAAAA